MGIDGAAAPVEGVIVVEDGGGGGDGGGGSWLAHLGCGCAWDWMWADDFEFCRAPAVLIQLFHDQIIIASSLLKGRKDALVKARP